MSRIGKKIKKLPGGVKAELNGDQLKISGQKGELSLFIPKAITVVIKDNEITVKVDNEREAKKRALWGTISSIIENQIEGVEKGFSKQLEINGVGFKALLKGQTLVLEVGFSHPVEIEPEAGVTFAVEKNIITVTGADKQQVGQAAARIRAVKPTEPYKGKGIKYLNEIVKRKAGKTAAKTAA